MVVSGAVCFAVTGEGLLFPPLLRPRPSRFFGDAPGDLPRIPPLTADDSSSEDSSDPSTWYIITMILITYCTVISKYIGKKMLAQYVIS